MLEVDEASPVWSSNGPFGFAAKNLIDGNLDRDQTHKSCYHTLESNLRPGGVGKQPYVNFTMTPMEVTQVELLTRDVGGPEGYGRSNLTRVFHLL